MWIPLLIWTLHFMNFTKGPDNAKILRFRRSSSVSRLCATGCETCSALNGCLSCKPRLFFHLELDGMKQRGTCLSSCPRGHYGTRSPRINTCTRCKDDCAFCFSENFCTRCHPGHFLFRGKCESSCPNGLTPNTALGECTDCPVGCEVCVSKNVCVRCRADLYFLHSQCHRACPSGFEPDAQLKQCNPQVHCEVGEWTDWSACIWKKTVREYRRGEETRTRQILQTPSVSSDHCPHVSEFRKCVMKKGPRLP
ncbi:R-spondin-3-like isoform X1 [Anabas testudineus]|uniref:R-spondin-3-like isoform X1 n=1 Tax=Anabas testudineus TaxID=64144 RepID=UPI000E4568DC|nr:R-spondin-3-like isoform X1 [Anabas testudineus]